MTFDEAATKVENLVGDLNIPLGVEGTLLDIIDKLREEYAPTVEMTKEEFEIFDMAKFDEDSAEWLDDVEWGLVNYKYPDFFMAWIHPETIKVVDE